MTWPAPQGAPQHIPGPRSGNADFDAACARREHQWIYAEDATRWSEKKQQKEKVYRYSPMADKRQYFTPVPVHDAPRFRGEVMHTLKVTPAGAEALARAAKRWGLIGTNLEAIA